MRWQAVALSLVASQGKVNAATKSFASQDPMRLGLEVKFESLNSKTTSYTGQPSSL